ncbi:MAG: hypothetical protein K0U68_06560 [Gammaproteobacteria bacterium]|nr:hypothetical protein [Gammaproteobacteria bacterium]
MTFKFPAYEKIVLFPLFTIVSTYLASLFWSDFIPSFITDQWVLYTGIALTIMAFLFAVLYRRHYRYSIDLFLTASLLIWVVYWQKEYTFQAPVFRSFTVYFVLINLVFGRFAHHEVFAEDQHILLNFLNRQTLFNAWLMALCVLISLHLQAWYMLYPVFASMLMISTLLMIWTDKIIPPPHHSDKT